MSEPAASVTAEESPSWDDVVGHAEHGDTVAVIAHGSQPVFVLVGHQVSIGGPR